MGQLNILMNMWDGWFSLPPIKPHISHEVTLNQRQNLFNKKFEMLSQAVAVAKIREAIAEARREAESQVR